MMSKRQWCVVLCILIVYLMLGAGIFYNIESQEEDKRLDSELQERKRIDVLLRKLEAVLPHGFEESFFKNLSDYCGKPIQLDMGDLPGEKKWDFYHALVFVFTVVSTIGYGNLAPTTMFSRILMIFYALIGIPMNGIVMVTLGEYFGRTFTKLYKRWKTAKTRYDVAGLGLISQVILYLIPGFTFFIFLPSVIMSAVEGWSYDVSVYYSFVSLSTIGFGDYVAGVSNVNHIDPIFYIAYQVFLLVWLIGGLGYVLMILGFITRGMRSKKVHKIEHIISKNIKKTPVRIRQELRTMLQEFLFSRVKPVYKGEFEYTPQIIDRSQSCPDLTLYRNMNSPTMMRKRALSECPRTFILHRIQSDTDLERIDKDRTFEDTEDFMKQKDLLMKVVDALDDMDHDQNHHAYHGLSDSQILASERYGLSAASAEAAKRRRAISEYQAPQIIAQEPYKPDLTWYGQDVAILENIKARGRTFSEPLAAPEIKVRNPGFLARLKNRLIPARDTKSMDVEKQELEATNEKRPSIFTDLVHPEQTRRGSLIGDGNLRRRASLFTESEERYLNRTRTGRFSVLSTNADTVLEHTSIADFLRALSAITVPETMLPSPNPPKRKMGTAGLSPVPLPSPPNTRRNAISANLQTRRTSLMPQQSGVPRERRRFSLRPVEENLPPPYSPHQSQLTLPTPSTPRKYSRTINMASIFTSPVQRQVNRKDKSDNS